MRISIHQPEHMPWLGFFNKAINCDIFVLLDTVQFEKDYFQNRNQIISNNANGREWLTIPVKKGRHTDLICEKQTAFNRKTKNKYLQQIYRAYSSYPFYRDIMCDITSIINYDDVYLSKLNIKLIKYFINLLNIKCKLQVSSDLQLRPCEPGGVINYNICKKLGATTYLSGKSGKNYLDETPYLKDNISVKYQNFKHPEYLQPRDSFISNLSILDLVFSLSVDQCCDIINEAYQI